MKSVASRLKLYGAISRSGRRLHFPQGRQSLSHHSSKARTEACNTRCTTMHQIPNPANARPMATIPAMNHEAKVTFESSAKRNVRTKIVFWIAHAALSGSWRKNTGAIRVISGMS